MGMEIDECIDILSYPTYYCSHLREKALDMAIATLRKYKKIQEIVEHYRENVRDKVTNENMEKILEVVEDGNDD